MTEDQMIREAVGRLRGTYGHTAIVFREEATVERIHEPLRPEHIASVRIPMIYHWKDMVFYWPVVDLAKYLTWKQSQTIRNANPQ